MTAARLPEPDEIVDRVLAAPGADGRVVLVEETSEVEVRFANNTTTTNGMRRQRRVTVLSMKSVSGGMASGVASRSGAVDVEELVQASQKDAESSPPAEDAAELVGPATGSATAQANGAASGMASGPASADDFAAPATSTDLAVMQHLLDDLPDAFARAKSAGHVLAGFATHQLDTVYLGTSAGLRLRHEQPTGSLELVARSTDGLRSTWAAAGTPWFADVDLPSVHANLQRRLGWAARRIDLPAGRYEAILPADATADFMVFLYGELSGRDAEEGRSVFSAAGGGTRLGDSVSGSPFELRSDPLEAGIECSPFLATGASDGDVSVFDNGLALGPTAWISGGRLERLFYSRARATRSGIPVAAPVDNLVLELPGAAGSVDDLVARTRRGLLLTCLWYIRTVDPVTALLTGLTRDGVYLVEDGEVVGAVNNFRFNESSVDVLSRAVEAGASTRAYSRESGEWMNRTVMPPLRIADFNMSSVSPAN